MTRPSDHAEPPAPPPATLAQKLVARAAGVAHVTPGTVVMCQVDLAMAHDSSGPRRVAPLLRELGVKVWDPSRFVVVTDHYVPAADPDAEAIVRFTRDWVREAGISNFIDGQGICHVVLPERGHVLPGRFIVGGDSHTPTGGAFGAYMFGIGATEMAGVLATGEIWLRVPQTIRIDWRGALGTGVCAKDMMLFLCARLGMAGGHYEAIEYTGAAVTALPMQERMTLCNMSTELGAQTGLVAPDATTLAWLAEAGVDAATLAAIDIRYLRSDAGAPVRATHRFDASTLAPRWPRRIRRPTARRWKPAPGSRWRLPTWAPAPAPSSKTCAWPPACCAGARWRQACRCAWPRPPCETSSRPRARARCRC